MVLSYKGEEERLKGKVLRISKVNTPGILKGGNEMNRAFGGKTGTRSENDPNAWGLFDIYL